MSVSRVQYNSINCNSSRGCRNFFDGSWGAYSDETRREARGEGWVVAVPCQRRYRPRMDFCPKHANEGLRILGRPLRVIEKKGA